MIWREFTAKWKSGKALGRFSSYICMSHYSETNVPSTSSDLARKREANRGQAIGNDFFIRRLRCGFCHLMVSAIKRAGTVVTLTLQSFYLTADLFAQINTFIYATICCLNIYRKEGEQQEQFRKQIRDSEAQ